MCYRVARSYRILQEFAQNDNDEVVGSVEGIVHDDLDAVRNWLEAEQVRAVDDVVSNLRAPVALLKSLNIANEYRRQGRGTYLLEWFIAEAESEDATVILLVPDVWQVQTRGFNLEAWYAAHGFESIDVGSAVPLMVLRLQDE
jgi:N-acetylglutamate synthase-like GNAT family acetyltransferase